MATAFQPNGFQNNAFQIDAAATVSGSFTVAAVVRKPGLAGSFDVNALVKKSATGSFTLQSIVKRSGAGSFSLYAIVKVTDLNTLAVDAVLKKSQAGSWTINALVKRTQASSFTVNAWIKGVGGTGVFTVSAVVRKPGNLGSFTLEALLKRTQPGSFTVNAWLKVSRTGSFTVNAVQKATDLNALTVDAVVIRRGLAGSFTINALAKVTDLNAFPVDALVKRSQPGSTTLNAWVVLVGQAIWTTPANGISIADLTPTFTFRIPAGQGPVHFDMELDAVSTFDSGALRSYESQLDQAGWEYWNGSAWVPVLSTGVPDNFDGNEARYTIQVPLTAGTWYRRVRAGVT